MGGPVVPDPRPLSPKQAGPVLREQDLLPQGFPYHPDWGTDWEDAREMEEER